MFNPHLFDNSRGDGFPVLEIAEPTPGPRQFVPLQRSELRGTVAGPVADLALTQVFGFSAQQSTAVVEAIYRFPLPGDAAVRAVAVRFGEVTIQAALKPRAEAEAEYAEAKQTGKQAALATREGADTFTLRIAGIQPNQPVTVVTHYFQMARPEGVGWSLRTPLTLAPRYIRQDEKQGRAPQQHPLAILRDPGHTFALELNVTGAETVTSPTHTLATVPDEAGMRVRLAAGEEIPDRDLVLQWALPQAGTRPLLHVLAHDDPAAGYIYFLAQVAPPRGQTTAVPREVTLLVDHSGSMSGPKWAAADWASEKLLRSLTDQDGFALGVFHNQTAWFAPTLRPGDTPTREEAIAWFKARRDSGGTELGVALEQALRMDKGSGAAARAILVITDGQVTDHARLFQLADHEFGSPQPRRISVLCIDSAPNDFLARQLAERGGGLARFLTSSPDEEDITTALDTILADWSAPALAGLRLVVDRRAVHAIQHRIVATPSGSPAIDLGDLPTGRALWVAGRVPRGDQGQFALRLELADGTSLADAAVAAGDQPGLAALFAAYRINELDYLLHAYSLQPEEVARRVADLGFAAEELAGVQPTTPPILYAENMKTPWQKVLAQLIQSESLAAGIPSSETAFVAVRQEAGSPVTQTVAVANALPQGWSDEFVGGQGVMARAPRALSHGLVQTFMAAPPPPTPQAQMRGLKMQAAGETVSRVATGGSLRVYAGEAAGLLQAGILFDSGDKSGALPAPLTLTGLTWTGDAAARQALAQAGDLTLALYIGDMAVPRARVRLTDLAMAGRRPLNLRCRVGERVRVALEGTAVPGGTGDQVELRLTW